VAQRPAPRTSFPLQRDKKGKVTPVKGVKGGFAKAVKEKKKWQESKKDYRRKEAARKKRLKKEKELRLKKAEKAGIGRSVEALGKALQGRLPAKYYRKLFKKP
jgi:hypothetical protein|tara:strand:+ start:456 stop:764 length:309 start_codon:yes stop_codon:yes gene_type:complete